MDPNETQLKQSRSSFITALAWIFIVLTGFSTLIAILQNVMISFFFPLEQMQNAMHSAKGGESIPAFAQFMLGHVRLLFATFLVLSATICAVSVGLLKRKNWARIAFISFLALGMVWNIAGVFLQGAFFSSMAPPPPNAPAEFRSQFESMTHIMLIFSSVIAIVISLLFAWLIKRLISVPIKAEFERHEL